jgi:hypothetical protein
MRSFAIVAALTELSRRFGRDDPESVAPIPLPSIALWRVSRVFEPRERVLEKWHPLLSGPLERCEGGMRVRERLRRATK